VAPTRLEHQRLASALEHRPHGLDSRGHQAADLRGLSFELQRAARDPRDVEQIVDEAHHVAELPVHRVERARDGRLPLLSPQEKVETGAERH
jgi:hypothetical protein